MVEIPQLQPLRLDTVVHMPVVCNDSCRMVQTPENCEGPAVAVPLNPCVDVPVVPVCWRSSLTRCGRPCEHAVTQSRSWRCLRISSSPDMVDIPVCTETGCFSVGCDDRVFRRIWRLFRAPPGCPGVERQFFEPSTMKISSSSRAPGGGGRWESDSQVTCHMMHNSCSNDVGLRSWWRHEQQSIAAVLATVTHHSHSKVGTANDAPRSQKKVTSTEVGRAEYYELSSDDGRPTRGGAARGTDGALAAGEAAAARRRRVRDRPESRCSCAAPLPNIVQFFAVQLPVVAEPVIEVPKILLDRTPQRLGDRLRQPQMVEQLVDVPTVVSYSSLQQLTAEQIVDIPVPGCAGGGRGGLQGFLSRQNSAAFYVEQTVDIPVPRSGGLQGSRPGQGSTASSSHVGAADGAGQGVFRTFPRLKKGAGLGPHSGSELGADFTPWT